MEITKDKSLKNIYFICSLTQKTKTSMQGALSSKGDLMGGIFDRWINTIPESVIFNEYIKPKLNQCKNSDIELIQDFYLYDPKEVGIAPDVLGIKINNKEIPFCIYGKIGNEIRWHQNKNYPQIEVKTLKMSQKMLTLRDQHYSGKYLIFAESTFNIDYLLPFFDKNLFNQNVFDELKMNNETFLEGNYNDYITQINKINLGNDKIGDVNVLVITKAEDFINKSIMCMPGESVQYINNNISEKDFTRIPQTNVDIPLSNYLICRFDNVYSFNEKWYDDFVKRQNIKTLDVKVDNLNSIKIIKINKSSIYIKVTGEATINNFKLKDDVYKIDFAILERSASSPKEYFLQKNICDVLNNNETNLISELNKVIKDNTNGN